MRTWSSTSLRSVPTKRSAKAFMSGARIAARTTRTADELNTPANRAPRFVSWSQTTTSGAPSMVVVCQNSLPRLDDERAACEPWTAMSLVLAVLGALRAALRTRTDLTLENLALRQQLALLRRRSKRPQFARSSVA